MSMTKEEVVRVCKRAGFYSTPELNERLYLQCKGYGEIGGLEEFVNAKAIWLEGNCLTEIKGLDTCTELLTLYLSRNLIGEITGLSRLSKLVKLDLADNAIKTVTGLEGCGSLAHVNLSKNHLKALAGLEGLLCVRETITTLDLSHNAIADEQLLDFLKRFPALASLRLMGNPVAGMRDYRRKFVAGLGELKSLDDTPVTDVERGAAVAYASGGVEAERAYRQRVREEDTRKEAARTAYFDECVRKAREERKVRAEKGEAAPATEYWLLNNAPATQPGRGTPPLPRTRAEPQELVDHVFHPGDDTAARDALRQASLKPRPHLAPVAFSTAHADRLVGIADPQNTPDGGARETPSVKSTGAAVENAVETAGKPAEAEPRAPGGSAVAEETPAAIVGSAVGSASKPAEAEPRVPGGSAVAEETPAAIVGSAVGSAGKPAEAGPRAPGGSAVAEETPAAIVGSAVGSAGKPAEEAAGAASGGVANATENAVETAGKPADAETRAPVVQKTPVAIVGNAGKPTGKPAKAETRASSSVVAGPTPAAAVESAVEAAGKPAAGGARAAPCPVAAEIAVGTAAPPAEEGTGAPGSAAAKETPAAAAENAVGPAGATGSRRGPDAPKGASGARRDRGGVVEKLGGSAEAGGGRPRATGECQAPPSAVCGRAKVGPRAAHWDPAAAVLEEEDEEEGDGRDGAERREGGCNPACVAQDGVGSDWDPREFDSSADGSDDDSPQPPALPVADAAQPPSLDDCDYNDQHAQQSAVESTWAAGRTC